MVVIGKPIPMSFDVPHKNPNNKPEDIPQIFSVWVSTYYPAVRTLDGVTEQSICADARPGDSSPTSNCSQAAISFWRSGAGRSNAM